MRLNHQNPKGGKGRNTKLHNLVEYQFLVITFELGNKIDNIHLEDVVFKASCKNALQNTGESVLRLLLQGRVPTRIGFSLYSQEVLNLFIAEHRC